MLEEVYTSIINRGVGDNEFPNLSGLRPLHLQELGVLAVCKRRVELLDLQGRFSVAVCQAITGAFLSRLWLIN